MKKINQRKNGDRHGYWEWYSHGGNMLHKVNYDKGIRIGYWEHRIVKRTVKHPEAWVRYVIK